MPDNSNLTRRNFLQGALAAVAATQVPAEAAPKSAP
ncbi:twin-arginine translocation signal domain-containing protein, partial [Pseudoduganella sp. RAF53_2]